MIRDLFPSYIDGLTSEESNKIVEEHVGECQECAKILKDMQDCSKKSIIPTEKDVKEINFLKKNKRRNFRIGLYCIIGALLCVFCVLFIRSFGVGMQRLGDENWHVEKLSFENGVIHFKATAVDSFSYISKIYVDEGNVAGEGSVVITPMIVFTNPFHTKDKEFEYKLDDPEKVKIIYFGQRIIWADGEDISLKTSELFSERHLYIGNPSANGKLANAINLRDLIGPYENQLETEKEPYGWIIKLSGELTEQERDLKEGYMDYAAYVMIALVQNLDHVTFRYVVNGEMKTKTITTEDATQILGQNVKDCYDNPRIFQNYLRKIGN